ncbi:dTDP-4-dehydrorhamnose reductase [Qipengyuania sp.]|uniref:dTDP-4-dehydrorhamnose reductase n=1 Tax=Qipengyuania sp. TaxID=2004515 RepID=UPI003735D717
MKALIVGAGGQVGRALARHAPPGVEVIPLVREALDIGDAGAVMDAVCSSGADYVFNAAAYTAVDRAESEPDQARAINAVAVGHLAIAAQAAKARLIHISTDFVFDGTASTPYPINAPPAPLGVYGATKLEGERLALALPGALVVRTSWVYDRSGDNFVSTMLRLMRERDELRVVADQVGSPTLAADLAGALWQLALGNVAGIRHYTNSGVASWYDFAVAIQEEALAVGRIDRAIPIRPIRTGDYPTPARRPPFSVLDCSETIDSLGTYPRHWRAALRSIFKESDT